MIKLIFLAFLIPSVIFADIPQEVIQAYEDLHFYPSLNYPNENFKELEPYFEDQKILIFCYDTLINPSSALKTISKDTYNQMFPAIAFGLTRRLNMNGKIEGFGQDFQAPYCLDREIPGHLNSGCALANAIPANTLSAMINGMVMAVDETELKKLIQRQKGYDLIPVIIMDWQDREPHFRGKPRIAYTFSAADQPRQGIIYTDNNLWPAFRYMERLRNGFYRSEAGDLRDRNAGWPAFRHFFEETTFFGNGVNIWRHYYILT